MSTLHERIISISKKHNLSHLGSCLTSVSIIDQIYANRKSNEPFILSAGHAGLALYVVLEKYLCKDAEALYLKHGTHPNRDLDDGIYCSAGSLGWGLTIALGMAASDRKRKVYCLISDGEIFEGSIWETANAMKRYNIDNLEIHLNWNGWSAYHQVNESMIQRVKGIFPNIIIHKTSVKDYGFDGLEAHYVKI